MTEKAILKQIILVTDGHSNQGPDPVQAAREASSNGITVNVIGVLHEGKLGEKGRQEIEAIAQGGEGVWDIVEAEALSDSMQFISRQSSLQTMEKLVSKQLKKVMEIDNINNLPPQKRGKVLQLMEEISESAYIQCLILLDCSGSMAPKLEIAKDSIVDLLLSLQARKGGGEMALIAFPGGKGYQSRIVSPFTQRVESLEKCLDSLKVSGGTPTGAAIQEAVSLFSRPVLEDGLVV